MYIQKNAFKTATFSVFDYSNDILYNTSWVIVMVGILMEPIFSKSLWCKTLYKSLTEELRKKRIPFCEIYEAIDNDLDAVFIIASDPKWTKLAITQLNQNDIQPILICEQFDNLSGCIYNCVCSDMNASIQNMVSTLRAKNKKRIAFYGINTSSFTDTSRIDCFFNCNSDFSANAPIFYNNGSLQNCFDEFFAKIDEFDAVICANDYAAISLIRNLEERAPEKLGALYIIGYGDTPISNYFNDRFLSLKMNIDQYGKAAVYIYNALRKHTYIFGMTVRVLWSLECAKPSLRSQNIHLELKPSEDSFYDDKEISEMIIVDRILEQADSTERKIIDLLLCKKTIMQIAEECFLTVGGVNYKINKIISAGGAKNKEEVVNLLNKYLTGRRSL